MSEDKNQMFFAVFDGALQYVGTAETKDQKENELNGEDGSDHWSVIIDEEDAYDAFKLLSKYFTNED